MHEVADVMSSGNAEMIERVYQVAPEALQDWKSEPLAGSRGFSHPCEYPSSALGEGCTSLASASVRNTSSSNGVIVGADLEVCGAGGKVSAGCPV